MGRIALWEKGDQPFWQGETEECINGRTLSDGVYFGADVSGIAARLITERQADGHWNCDRCHGSLRSSFANTINVLEGRSAFEQATGITPALRAALEAGQDYLLTRQIFRRASNGAVVDPDVLVLYHPWRWHYDILRALEYFRTSGVSKDRRLQQAADLLESRRLADGRWLLEPTSRGRVWFQRQPSGAQSRWITLQALRVLTWWNAWPGPKIPRRNLAPDAPRECATHLSTSLIPHFKMF